MWCACMCVYVYVCIQNSIFRTDGTVRGCPSMPVGQALGMARNTFLLMISNMLPHATTFSCLLVKKSWETTKWTLVSHTWLKGPVGGRNSGFSYTVAKMVSSCTPGMCSPLWRSCAGWHDPGQSQEMTKEC